MSDWQPCLSHEPSTLNVNGVSVYLEQRQVPLVTFTVAVRVASAQFSTQPGAAHCLEHIVCSEEPSIGQSIERLGGLFSAKTTRDAIQFSVTIDPEQWQQAFSIVYRRLVNVPFENDDVLSREKQIIALEINRDAKIRRQYEHLTQFLWPRSPYTMSPVGKIEALKDIGLDVLRELYQRSFCAGNVCVTVVGMADRSSLTQLLDKLPAFGESMKGTDQPISGYQYTSRSGLFIDETRKVAFLGAYGSGEEKEIALVFPIFFEAISQGLRSGGVDFETVVQASMLFRYAGAYGLAGHGDKGVSEIEKIAEALTKAPRLPVQTVKDAVRDFKRERLLSSARIEAVAAEKVRSWVSFNDFFEAERIVGRMTPQSANLANDIIRVLTGKKVATDQALGFGTGTPDRRARRKPVATEGPDRLSVLAKRDGLAILAEPISDSPTLSWRLVYSGGSLAEASNEAGFGRRFVSLFDAKLRHRGGIASPKGFSGKNSLGWLCNDTYDVSAHALRQLLDRLYTSDEFLDDGIPINAGQSLNQGAAKEILFSKLFPTHPYGHDGRLLGKRRDDDGGPRDELDKRAWHWGNRITKSKRAVLALSGCIKPDLMEVLSCKDKWNDTTEVDWQMPPRETERVAVELSRCVGDRPECEVALGYRASSIEDTWKYPNEVLASMLSGKGGFLFDALRVKKRLSYSTASFCIDGAFGYQGMFMIYAATTPTCVEEVIDTLGSMLERAATGEFTDSDLKRAKSVLCTIYGSDLQNQQSRATQMAFGELYGVGHQECWRYFGKIKNVEHNDIKQAASRLLNSEKAVVVLDPRETH